MRPMAVRSFLARALARAKPSNGPGLGLGAGLAFAGLVGLSEVALADEAEHGCARRPHTRAL